jgi:hypothetical protein
MGTIVRYRARLVAKGYLQQAGTDYTAVWAPVSQMTTLRVFLAFVAARDLELKQLDVQTAFLRGDVHEELCMKQPPGYECTLNKKCVCRLAKALHGLEAGLTTMAYKTEGSAARLGLLGLCGNSLPVHYDRRQVFSFAIGICGRYADC